MKTLLQLLWEPTLQTIWMVGVSALLSGVGGLVLGVLLVTTSRDQVLSAPWLYRTLNTITNIGRSVPFIILMVAIIPLTRWLVGTAIGTTAAMVPLVIGAIPYVGRLVEGALREVDSGVIEAVLTMGATPWQTIRKAYLPEAVPALIRAMTVVTITLVSYSAMAGAIGGGGLGDLAIRYGYQGFRPDVMISTVVVLVVFIQVIQFLGDALARHYQRTEQTLPEVGRLQKTLWKWLAVPLLAGIAVLFFFHHRGETRTKPLRVGVNPIPHGEILESVLPLLKKQGVEVQVVYFSDYVQPNLALVSGDLDANYFQHVPFMENFNRAHGSTVISVGKVHIEPLGIYAGTAKSIRTIPDGAVVAIPNDPANSGRALLLLQGVGLIRLRTGTAVGATEQDIQENPKHLRIRELEAAQLPRSLPDVAIAVINMNYALAAKLDPRKDALELESSDSPYANVLSTMPAKANDARVIALLRALQSPEAKEFILAKYKGAVLPAFP
ncbi:MAG: Lipoprotein YaeC family [Acidobacteriaceae bacterium]|nr:Lipoprotein YaeC family [Acidobacteriaceae bacterium]